MLANVFENFRNMSLKINELDPEKFLSIPRLSWQAAVKNNVTWETNCVLSVQVEYLYYCNFVEVHCIHYCLKMWTVVHERSCWIE